MRILPEFVSQVNKQCYCSTVRIYWRNPKEMREVRGRDIAMIFQDPMTSLNPVETVGAQIEEMIKLHNNLKRKELRKAAEDMLEVVGIKGEIQ